MRGVPQDPQAGPGEVHDSGFGRLWRAIRLQVQEERVMEAGGDRILIRVLPGGLVHPGPVHQGGIVRGLDRGHVIMQGSRNGKKGCDRLRREKKFGKEKSTN